MDAPDFSLPDLSGKQIPLKQLRGKLVFLNFFATWCGPCREEMPGMEWLHRAHQDKGLVVLAVNLQESAKTIRPFVQSLRLSFPTVMDAEGAVSREYGVRALPVSFLIGRDGKIVWRFTAEGRVDSPPTYHQGLILFGSLLAVPEPKPGLKKGGTIYIEKMQNEGY